MNRKFRLRVGECCGAINSMVEFLVNEKEEKKATVFHFNVYEWAVSSCMKTKKE